MFVEKITVNVKENNMKSNSPFKITDAAYEKQNRKMRSKHKSETGKTLGSRQTSGKGKRRISFACRFAGMAGAMKDSKGQPIKGTGSKGGAVAQEINRRYAREVTYKGDSTLSKKKWSGLQGDFFQNQKNADLGRDSKYKKKDIV